ncbi:branched-chain amino acid ABC transporter substrate-binding protein [Noviherbaspirillum cavernae]|uniref:Branched-chain amino acid ABC transporter substrate-binding protein n=1 Tax=Noviherbaspirillum cavernae TaxID=2320862 RepID=A0A418WW42_9BURK|nr:ABC transporter substrate-binding protein [Noviherbaspirillum cavernae]RJF96905.1 branched-chain amino acid ABC transporter substrate-binding protein [Noviherbaspirillum cavernae]
MFGKTIKRVVQVGVALSFSVSAYAQQEVKIGVIYPLTGAAASSGAEMKNALELAADIINNGAKGIPDLPFSAGGGLPNLKGAKIKLIFADHQGNPQVGATEAERLITQEKVIALVGAYQSNVTATASQVAERNKVPFLNPESSSATLTQRNFKWFFRTTAHDDLFVQNFFDFFKDMEAKKGIQVKQLGAFNENTLWGNETTKLETKLAQEKGYNLVKTITYPAKSTQLTSEVQALKAGGPQVVMQSSYLGDAILAMKTYKELGFSPDMILANNAGFTDTEFIRTLGKDADYVITREVWSLDLAKKNPLIKQVNDLFNSRYKANFTGNSSRTFTGLMTLADAINRAGSTDTEAVRKALTETNIPGSKLIMPWKGIKFDATGQNVYGSGILVQIIDGKYNTVWPFDLATRDVTWPMPKWDQRK